MRHSTEADLIIRIRPCFSSLKNAISRGMVLVCGYMCERVSPHFATWHDLVVLFKVSGGDNNIVKHLQLGFYQSDDSDETRISVNWVIYFVLSFI